MTRASLTVIRFAFGMRLFEAWLYASAAIAAGRDPMSLSPSCGGNSPGA